MTVFLIGAIVCIILDLLLLYRVFRGPTAADRICAMDALDLVTALALVLYSLHTGRTIWTSPWWWPCWALSAPCLWAAIWKGGCEVWKR